MTTKNNTETTTTNEAPAAMTAWDMAISILVGLRKAEAKAREEFDTLRAANPNNPFAVGMGLSNDLLNTVATSRRDLEIELRRMARSNGLSIPAEEVTKV